MKGSQKIIYADYASGAPLDPLVLEAMMPYFIEHSANPGAIHQEGVFLERAITDARKTVGELIYARPQEIVFTGSGTEALNLAILGTVRRAIKEGKVKPHVITTAIEHSAVLEPLYNMEKEGVIRLDIIPVDAKGMIDPKNIRDLLSEDTVLVAVMMANNEIGTIQPVREVTKVVRDWKKDKGIATVPAPSEYPYVLTDACQAFGALETHVERLSVDMLAMNATKIHGPKGIGMLYVRRGVKLEPLIYGGGQEVGLRSGTENVPGIVGLAKAMQIADAYREKESDRLTVLRNHLWKEISKRIEGVVINGDLNDRLPGNLNITVRDADHQYLALAMDAAGILLGTKSACRANDDGDSHVLKALREAEDGDKNLIAQGIRISLGRETIEDDITKIVEALERAVPLARASKTV